MPKDNEEKTKRDTPHKSLPESDTPHVRYEPAAASQGLDTVLLLLFGGRILHLS